MYLLSSLLAKTINWFITNLNLGAGYTWPGHLGLKLCPTLFDITLAKNSDKLIFVSGTNGKTTTSKLIAHLLQKQGKKVLHNYTGANLLNGVASCVLVNSSLTGKLDYDYIVLELDELTLPKMLSYVSPKILVLLNLSRDQLDRHWEIDVVLNKWLQAVSKLPIATNLIYSIDQPEFFQFDSSITGVTKTFSSAPLNVSNPLLKISFNAKNLNAACITLESLGFDLPNIDSLVKDFTFAYGRGEIIDYGNKKFQIFLAKNPASVNSNLELLASNFIKYDSVLFILNDNVPDGHDVSWIYDIDPVLLSNVCTNKKVYCAGTRAGDMLIRLNYAITSNSPPVCFHTLSEAVTSISQTANVENIVVLPNYSAMLEIRKELIGRRI